jgi:hypothetical protein
VISLMLGILRFVGIIQALRTDRLALSKLRVLYPFRCIGLVSSVLRRGCSLAFSMSIIGS